MRTVFEIQNSDDHEVLEALNFDNVKTWRKFIKMEDEDEEELTKSAPSNNSNRAPVTTSTKRELMSFVSVLLYSELVNDYTEQDNMIIERRIKP